MGRASNRKWVSRAARMVALRGTSAIDRAQSERLRQRWGAHPTFRRAISALRRAVLRPTVAA